VAAEMLADSRDVALAATRGYRNALWAEEGAPEVPMRELARRKRIAISEAQNLLAETTGWPAEQIRYDPLLERTITPFDREGEPPFFPDEVRFGARALLKESDWWQDKLVPPDRLSRMQRTEQAEPDGGAGKMSRFLAAATVGAAGAMLMTGEAAAAPITTEAGFAPVGYDMALGLVDELVFVIPGRGEPKGGRLSFLDILALTEERKPHPRLFPAAKPEDQPGPQPPKIDWTEDKVEPEEPPRIDWEEEEEEEEEKKPEKEEPEEEEKEEEKKEEPKEEEEEEEEKKKSTLVYRLKRTALFSTSPSSFEWSSEPEKVFVIEEPEEFFEPIPSAGIDRVYPLSLRRIPVSQFADEEVSETAKAPLMVAGVYPRAVLVTATRMSSEVPVAPPLREIARRRELLAAPPAAKRKFVSAGPEPFDPRLSRLLRRASLKQPLTKAELRSAAASRSYATLGDVYWKIAAHGFPELKTADAGLPGMMGARKTLFSGLRRLAKIMRISEEPTPWSGPEPPTMKLVRPGLLRFLGSIPGVDSLADIEPPDLEDLEEMREKAKLFKKAIKATQKAAKKIKEERTYEVEKSGAVEKRGRYLVQKFEVVKRPRLVKSLLDVHEFQVVRAAAATPAATRPAPALKPALHEGPEAGPARAAFAREIAAAMMTFAGPARSLAARLSVPALSRATARRGRLSLSGAPAEALMSRLAKMAMPMAAMFMPMFVRRRPTPKPTVEGGKMVAPGLFEFAGGRLTAVIPRQRTAAAAAHLEPADFRSLFPKSAGVAIEVSPGELEPISKAALARGWEVKPLRRPKDAATGSVEDAKMWSVDDAELIATVPLRSRMGGTFYRLAPKRDELKGEMEALRYEPVASAAEPPVRRPRKAAHETKAPEPARPVGVKKVSSDPLKDFDERVLDELMFALKRRMEVERESRGGTD